MQRYNEPAEPVDPPSPSILDSPSDRSPPRRADLRQATLLDSPSSQSAPASLRSEDDDAQLARIFSTVHDLIREDLEYEEARTDVHNLEGHQDLKDMIDAVRGTSMIDGIRQLADMLELIENKRDALEAVDQLERISNVSTVQGGGVDEPSALASNVFDSDDELSDDEISSQQNYAGIVFDSDDEDVPDGPYDPFAAVEEAETDVEPMTESDSEDEAPARSNLEQFFDSETESEIEDVDSESDSETMVSARLRF